MLGEDYAIRELRSGDGAALAAAYRRNREHLAPWDPDRPESFYTDAGQEIEVERNLALSEEGRTYVNLIWYGEQVVGRLMLSNIVRYVLQSGTVGYWVDHEHLRRGLATSAVGHAVVQATRLGLHRLEAGTAPTNTASQAVLRRSGFEEYGRAERFLFIRGEWRDQVLFQRILHDDPPGNPVPRSGVDRA
ncbi:GNAT family protein [Nocardioides conyzicola]|uniref:Ribosomal protein S5-alanine N-acetyltransferase n=1 Tax=Nocardioides conyzicola TaxID=1651781 RepID=A0ABP8XVE9_9ACTN